MGGVPSEREGVPITSLSAFSVPVVGGGKSRFDSRVVAMVAVGWSDGSWAVAPCCHARPDTCNDTRVATCTSLGSVVGCEDVWEKACSSSSGDLAAGDTGGLGPALHVLYQVRPGCVRNKDAGAMWRQGALGVRVLGGRHCVRVCVCLTVSA